MATMVNLEVIGDHSTPVTSLWPVETELDQHLGHRLVMGAFRVAGRRRRVRRWVARQIAQTDYVIAGPPTGPEQRWGHDNPDLRCWVLPERHAS